MERSHVKGTFEHDRVSFEQSIKENFKFKICK